MRSSTEFWDRAADDYEAGREVFPPNHGYRWRTHGRLTVGVDDIGDVNGKTLLELGCGDGAVLRALATSFPAAKFIGLDFSSKQLALSLAQTRDLQNVSLVQADARLAEISRIGPYDELLSVYGAVDFVEDVRAVLDRFLPGLTDTGACSVLTSKTHVIDTLAMHPRLSTERYLGLGRSWFMRARKSR